MVNYNDNVHIIILAYDHLNRKNKQKILTGKPLVTSEASEANQSFKPNIK